MSDRSELRTEYGWARFDRIAAFVSLVLALLLLVLSLLRAGAPGTGTPDPVPLAKNSPPSATVMASVDTGVVEPPAGSAPAGTMADSGSATLPTDTAPSGAAPAGTGSEDAASADTASGGAASEAPAPIAAASPAPGAAPFERLPTRIDQPIGVDRPSANERLVKPILDLRSDKGKVVIDGIVSDPETRAAIIGAALQAYGMRNLTDRLSVSSGVAPFGWSERAADVIALLGDRQVPATVRVDGDAVVLGGEAPTLDDKEIRGQQAQHLFGTEIRLDNRVRVTRAATLAAASGAAARVTDAATEGTLEAATATGAAAAQPAPSAAAVPTTAPTAPAAAGGAAARPATDAGSGAGSDGGPTEVASAADTASAPVIGNTSVPEGFRLAECARITTGISIPFASGSSALTAEGRSALRAVRPCLERRRYIVGGHTDSRGGSVGNLILSQARAQAAVDYLVSQGVPADQLVAKGYGEERPITTNNTEEGRATNRRIDFRFAN